MHPPPEPRRIVIAGGGAAGFFAAITCAETRRDAEVFLLEKSARVLAKVRVSGGGRCNVTHACFDPRLLASAYPRGGRALIGAFHRFQPRDTVEWFESRGVAIKTEADGRMFPRTDSSQTVIDCLTRAASAAGVKLFTQRGIVGVSRRDSGGFALTLSDGETLTCDRLLLATGGCRSGGGAAAMAAAFGHTIEPPVPSLFTFHIDVPWLRTLPGVSVADAEVSVPGSKLCERGPLLVTHSGLSGPAILRLSAWGARELHGSGYEFPLHLDWLPQTNAAALASTLQNRRVTEPARLVVNSPLLPLPARLWEQLVLAAGIAPDTRWTTLPRTAQQALAALLKRTVVRVTGKTLNKDEFVTCGGVRLSEVDFKTMESRVCPGLHFAGELLDVDGITGGYNFQAAWTTGWLAGKAMAEGR